jgi:hypothetical protein
VITEKEIYQSALVLIKQHGDHASLIAAQRADDLLKAGDVDGERLWLKIIAAIRILSATERDSTLH